MPEQITDLSARPEGCRAKLIDDGERSLIPVCLGGVSITGCNSASKCSQLYYDRINRGSSAHIFFKDKENEEVVVSVATVPRGSLLSEEVKVSMGETIAMPEVPAPENSAGFPDLPEPEWLKQETRRLRDR